MFENHLILHMYKNQLEILLNFVNEYYKNNNSRFFFNEIFNYLDWKESSSIIKCFRSSGLLYLYQINDTGYKDLTWHSKRTVRPPFSVIFCNVFIHCIFVDTVLKYRNQTLKYLQIDRHRYHQLIRSCHHQLWYFVKVTHQLSICFLTILIR